MQLNHASGTNNALPQQIAEHHIHLQIRLQQSSCHHLQLLFLVKN